MNDPLQEDLDFLAHFGKKGMKWGVRRDRRANTLAKVGRGEGTTGEKARALASVSVVGLVRNKGLKGAAKKKGELQLARNERVRDGKATATDKLKFYGGSRMQDVFPTGKSSTNTKAAIGASIVGTILVVNGAKLVGRALA